MCVCVCLFVCLFVGGCDCMDTHLIDCGGLIVLLFRQHYGDQKQNINYIVGT